MSFGPGQETRTFVGAAGSSTMRQRMLEIVYEVTLRYDDGRFGLVELPDASRFRVGDRVRVVDNQLELLPRDR
jgi:outer membrane lipoprotein SlyB